MKYVAFTGPAFDKDGQNILRKDLHAAAEAVGHVVQENVNALTDLLVASKTDTVKAKIAAKLGIPTVAFQDYIEKYGLKIVKSGAKPDKYVDGDPDDQVPDFTRPNYGSLL